ncbi:Pirin [Scedosporium apiospermum]|uniref:Pirin n=1 Tax=Pseudallescheria apiosperma TaxID=563466 RepID=A0A084GHU6_PSEDA|nr:Pirin [Scedosporium apiospermum]KEZ46908.1 Pirin [Scedosporium apiospermum]
MKNLPFIIPAIIIAALSIIFPAVKVLDLLSYTFEPIIKSINSVLSTPPLGTLFEDPTSTAQLRTNDDTTNEPLSVLENKVDTDGALPVDNMSVSRAIRKVFLASQQAEGAGAKVRRSIGTPQLRNFSPFLMLDHFSVNPGAGFPDHPHRGQETITYLLEGGIDHEDFAGNSGSLNPGDLQFMTAGRGIVHAEMPRQNADGSANVGLQLWVDLPKNLKSCEPRYRDLRASEIPQVTVDDDKVTIKVISGQSHGVDSVKDLAYTPVWILDVTMKPGGKITQPLPEGWNAFAYTLEGDALFGEGDAKRKVEQYHNVVFEPEGQVVHVEVEPTAAKEARFVIVAGTPLDQPVVQYGPFVLTTKDEVYKAIMDYQGFTNGFERARDWESEIGKSMKH